MTVYQVFEANIIPKFVIRHGGCFIPVRKQSRNQVLQLQSLSQLSPKSKVKKSAAVSTTDTVLGEYLH